jgi:hypothetical protein
MEWKYQLLISDDDDDDDDEITCIPRRETKML